MRGDVRECVCLKFHLVLFPSAEFAAGTQELWSQWEGTTVQLPFASPHMSSYWVGAYILQQRLVKWKGEVVYIYTVVPA